MTPCLRFSVPPTSVIISVGRYLDNCIPEIMNKVVYILLHSLSGVHEIVGNARQLLAAMHGGG